MKRKQLIALIGSVSLALTSCSGAASYAAEETEIFQMETSLEDTALTEAESFSEEETVSPEETQTDAQSESLTDEDAGEMNEGAGDEETGIPLPAADGHEEGSGQETETQAFPDLLQVFGDQPVPLFGFFGEIKFPVPGEIVPGEFPGGIPVHSGDRNCPDADSG